MDISANHLAAFSTATGEQPAGAGSGIDGVGWYGGFNEVIRFDGVNSTRFDLGQADRGLQDCCVASLAIASDGSVWAQGGTDIVHIENGQVTRYEVGDPAIAEWMLFPTAEGDVWVFRHLDRGGYQTAYFDGVSWSVYEQAEAIGRRFPIGRTVWSAVETAQPGVIWMLSTDPSQVQPHPYRLYQHTEGSWRAVRLPASRGRNPGTFLLNALAPSPDGSVWIRAITGVAHFVPAD